MSERFSIIYADPPWAYDDKLDVTRTLKYPTMTEKELAALRVADLAADDCALFMWATFPTLWESKRKAGQVTTTSRVARILDAWGFEYVTVGFVWIKVNKLTEVNQASFFPSDSFDAFWGGGHWTRANAEICLIARRGKPKRVDASVHQVIYAPIDEHSRKPPETRDRIVKLMGDLPRVELFARQTVSGWSAWGNQVESTVEVTT